jgi:hypothetical protein
MAGMAAFYLNSWRYGHRPTFVSMDDLFEGFRYYGNSFRTIFCLEIVPEVDLSTTFCLEVVLEVVLSF